MAEQSLTPLPPLPPVAHDGDGATAQQRLRYFANQGLLQHAIPTAAGGLGDDFQALVTAHRAMGQHCKDPGLVLSLNAHLWGSVFPLLTYGTPAQQQRWLPSLLRGQCIGGHAITEPAGGSDLMALATRATQTTEGFELNGCKRYVTNTPIADMLIIYAREEQGLSAFIVQQDDPGVQFTAQTQVSGCRSATMGDVLLQGCVIPKERQLGKSGAGTMMIQGALELERAFIFAGISGIMQWQLAEVLRFSRTRHVHGAPLAQQQSISHTIADMQLRLASINLWLNECARLKDQQQRITLASAQTKLFASEAFLQSSLDAVHIMGAHGLEADNPLATLVQDAQASRLFSGSSEIQRNIIAALLGIGDALRR